MKLLSLLSLLSLSLLSLLLSLAIIGFIKKTKETYINTYTYDNSLVYLYLDNCPRCDKFKETWDEIKNKTDGNSKYEFNVNSFNINDEDKGTKIATEKGYTYAPVILFITPKGISEYINEGEMTADKILEWCIKMNKCSIK